MFCTKCNFQSEQTFETPCMAGWVKGKEKFQESFEIFFLGGGGGGGGAKKLLSVSKMLVTASFQCLILI